MILINNNFEQKVEKVKIDKNGNYIILDTNIQGKRITLVNLDVPNQDNSFFLRNLSHKIAEFENDQIIMCGDWNFILNPDIDCEKYLHVNNPNARRVILNYIEEENLIDVWRVMNEDSKKYTRRRLNPTRKQALLDFILVSENLFQFTFNTDKIPGYRTDHNGILLNLKLANSERGKGYLKINHTLLKDLHYHVTQKVKGIIEEVKRIYYLNSYALNINQNIESNINDQLFLETLLMMIRGMTIKYSSEKNKKRKKKTKQNN